MKHKFFLFLCLLIFVAMSGFSQTIQLSELITKASCKDFTCYNDFITRKGFSFNKNNTDTGGITYIYFSDSEFATTSNPAIIIRDLSVLKIDSAGVPTVLFGTGEKSHYQSFYDQLAKLGFTQIKTTSKNDKANTVETLYQSEKYPKTEVVFSIQAGSSDDSTFTFYSFAVKKTQPGDVPFASHCLLQYEKTTSSNSIQLVTEHIQNESHCNYKICTRFKCF